MNKKISVLIGLVIFMILITLLVRLFPKQECGSFTTAIPEFETIECNCIGFKSTNGMIGGGPVYCKGICLKETCKTPDYVYEQIKKAVIDRFQDQNQKKSMIPIIDLTWRYDEENYISYALRNIENETIEFKVNYFCESGEDGTNCSRLNFTKTLRLESNETKVDILKIKIEKDYLKPQRYIWKINFIVHDYEIYDSKDFFITLKEGTS